MEVRVSDGGTAARVVAPAPHALADDALAQLRTIATIHSDAGHPLTGFVYEFHRSDDGGWSAGGELAYA